MVIGDMVKFRFKYETPHAGYIKPGELGLIVDQTKQYVVVLHLGLWEEITLKKKELQKLEDK